MSRSRDNPADKWRVLNVIYKNTMHENLDDGDDATPRTRLCLIIQDLCAGNISRSTPVAPNFTLLSRKTFKIFSRSFLLRQEVHVTSRSKFHSSGFLTLLGFNERILNRNSFPPHSQTNPPSSIGTT
jgi:hypothetical protein